MLGLTCSLLGLSFLSWKMGLINELLYETETDSTDLEQELMVTRMGAGRSVAGQEDRV